jgi:hypothetical protein
MKDINYALMLIKANKLDGAKDLRMFRQIMDKLNR